jgi:hypothetical protein
MNNAKLCEIHFGEVTIDPGQLFQLVAGTTGKAGHVPVELVVDCSSTSMIINFLRASGKDLLASGSALPAGTLGRTALTLHPIDENAELSLGVTNLSDSPQKFTAVLLLEKVAGPSLADEELHRILDEAKVRPEDLHLESQTLEDEDEEPGLLAKCWGWFKQGMAVAMTDLAEDPPALKDLVRPARARDSLRRLVSDFVDAAEIPLMAAALYWEQIADLAHGVGRQAQAIPSTVGFGPQTIKSGTIGEVTIQVVGRFRPQYLKMDWEASHNIRIVDVRIGKDSVLLSPCPIPGTFASEGIHLGGNQIALSDVIVVIENFTVSDVEVSGILDGEQVSFTHA